MLSLPEFLERHLGEIARGNSLDAEHIQCVEFRDAPYSGVNTIATLGLSHHVLGQDKGTPTRIEYLSIARPEDADGVMNLLEAVVEITLKHHVAPPPGQLMRLPGPLFPGATVTAVIVLSPVAFPKAFDAQTPTEPGVNLVWVLPLTPHEVDSVERLGAQAFMDALSEDGLAVEDFRRRP